MSNNYRFTTFKSVMPKVKGKRAKFKTGANGYPDLRRATLVIQDIDSNHTWVLLDEHCGAPWDGSGFVYVFHTREEARKFKNKHVRMSLSTPMHISECSSEAFQRKALMARTSIAA